MTCPVKSAGKWEMHCRQKGLTLVEILIAMFLGIVLTAGILQIFINNQRLFRVQDGNAKLQENARFSMEILENDVRQAGYQGCMSLTTTTPNLIANAPITALTTATALTGNESTGAGVWNPGLSAALTALPTPPGSVNNGTDVLNLQFAQSCSANLSNNMATASANILIPTANTCGFTAGNAVLISDCNAVDLFRVTTVTSAGGIDTIQHSTAQNTTGSVSRTYSLDAELMKFSSFSYFVGNGVNGQPALWRLDNTQAVGVNNPIELVEGVEDMQILYGIDVDGDGSAEQYIRGDQLIASTAGWNNVASVRISLLMRTLVDNLTTSAQTYSYNGAIVTAGDNRFRRIFTSTIGIRNRLP